MGRRRRGRRAGREARPPPPARVRRRRGRRRRGGPRELGAAEGRGDRRSPRGRRGDPRRRCPRSPAPRRSNAAPRDGGSRGPRPSTPSRRPGRSSTSSPPPTTTTPRRSSATSSWRWSPSRGPAASIPRRRCVVRPRSSPARFEATAALARDRGLAMEDLAPEAAPRALRGSEARRWMRARGSHAFQRWVADTAAERREPWRFGTHLADDTFPTKYDANFLRVERSVGDATAAELPRDRRRTPGGAPSS